MNTAVDAVPNPAAPADGAAAPGAAEPHGAGWLERRHWIESYFDRTAATAWARLTSDAPVGRIRATVRAGRDTMRAQLLDWLPADLRGRRVLDAGCGTGMLAVEAARRGARVVAVDISPTLVELGRERMPADVRDSIEWRAGDFLDHALGTFDHVVAMDSLIHYGESDVLDALGSLAGRTRSSLLFTFAPRTPLLAAMHAIGRFFPHGDRSPSIVPLAADRLWRLLLRDRRLVAFAPARSRRVVNGFYLSHGLELARR